MVSMAMVLLWLFLQFDATHSTVKSAHLLQVNAGTPNILNMEITFAENWFLVSSSLTKLVLAQLYTGAWQVCCQAGY